MPHRRQTIQGTAKPLPRARADLASFPLASCSKARAWKTCCCTLAGPFIGLSSKAAASEAYHISDERHYQPEAGRWCRDYLSSQTSSMRAPLEMLLTMIVKPFT